MVRPSLPTIPFQPTYTVIGTHISTTAYNYLVHQVDPPPVLLTVGWDDDNWDGEIFRPKDVEDEFPRRMFIDEGMPVSPQPFSSRTRTCHQTLDQLLAQFEGTVVAEKTLLTLAAFPLMHLDTLQIQAKTRYLRQAIRFYKGQYTEVGQFDLQTERFLWGVVSRILKAPIEISRDSLIPRVDVTYRHVQNTRGLRSCGKMRSAKPVWSRRRFAISYNFRLASCRYRNLRSLSNYLTIRLKKVEEVCGLCSTWFFTNEDVVKICMYIPNDLLNVRLTPSWSYDTYVHTCPSQYSDINLGMNIQQVNNTGHNIWVFAITSFAALFVTGTTWYLIETINHVRASARSAQNFFEVDAPNYHLAFRLTMLWWLAMHGHISWMWNTMALSRILKNDNTSFISASEIKNSSSSGRRIVSACDYVAYFMNKENAFQAKVTFGINLFGWLHRGRESGYLGLLWGMSDTSANHLFSMLVVREGP